LRYEIETGGRLRYVEVRGTNGAFSVTVDGRRRRVDAVRIDADTLSLLVGPEEGAPPQPSSPDEDGRPDSHAVYETTILAGKRTGRLVVGVGTVPVAVTLQAARGRRAPEPSEAAGARPLRIAAPMPGRVVRVLVKAGDVVRAREPVVVVEAMKMENELRTDREGTVAEVLVREGMSVEAGALLAVIR
jgi:biotin carboxyl carrier protein